MVSKLIPWAAIQGCGYGKHRYRGPKPPFNWSHIYHFNVFSLDCRLDLPSTARKKDLLAAMQGHILQKQYWPVTIAGNQIFEFVR